MSHVYNPASVGSEQRSEAARGSLQQPCASLLPAPPPSPDTAMQMPAEAEAEGAAARAEADAEASRGGRW